MYDEHPPAAAHALLEQGWRCVDVRTPDEFRAGHAPGALNVPFALVGPAGLMPNPQFLQVVRRAVSPEPGLVVVGAGGTRAPRACQMLAQAGFPRLVVVAGGFSGARDADGAVASAGWEGAGLPAARGEDEGSYAAILARLRAGGDQG